MLWKEKDLQGANIQGKGAKVKVVITDCHVSISLT